MGWTICFDFPLLFCSLSSRGQIGRLSIVCRSPIECLYNVVFKSNISCSLGDRKDCGR